MKLFSKAMLTQIASQAAASPRQRAHHNIHASAADPIQRFFVVANRNSYFRPHRHTAKSEMAIVLRGTFDVVTFDDTGAIAARYVIGEGADNLGYETPADTWHTLIAHADGATFLEVKQGPYDPATAAVFAPWAPTEDDPVAREYLERLRSKI